MLRRVDISIPIGFLTTRVEAVYSELVSEYFPVNGKNTGNFLLFSGKIFPISDKTQVIRGLQRLRTNDRRKLTGNYQGIRTNYYIAMRWRFSPDTSGSLKVLAMNRRDLDFHMLVQTIQYRYQSVNRKTPEICIPDS